MSDSELATMIVNSPILNPPKHPPIFWAGPTMYKKMCEDIKLGKWNMQIGLNDEHDAYGHPKLALMELKKFGE